MRAAETVDATVVITTKNRRDDLRTAVQSAVNQTADVEVLVIDDGSSDGTAEMIREDFPDVRLCREEESAGLIVRRNQAAELAEAPILFSLDDDAEFSSRRVVEQILPKFDDPRVGAVAIPYIDVRRSPETKQKAPKSGDIYCTSAFRGTAHALRRDVFLQVGGYREHLRHQGEERDYCIRMLDHGYVVCLGRSDVIHHYESPKRSFDRMGYFGRRNDILFAWQNAPGSVLPWALSKAVVNSIRTAVRHRRYRYKLWGMLAGLYDCVQYSYERDPVRRSTYREYMELRKRPKRIEDINNI